MSNGQQADGRGQQEAPGQDHAGLGQAQAALPGGEPGAGQVCQGVGHGQSGRGLGAGHVGDDVGGDGGHCILRVRGRIPGPSGAVAQRGWGGYTSAARPGFSMPAR